MISFASTSLWYLGRHKIHGAISADRVYDGIWLMEEFLAILCKIRKGCWRRAALGPGSFSIRLNEETVTLKQVYSIGKYEGRGQRNCILLIDLQE